MLENIQSYLSKQGVKYIKPEKAGPHQEEMEDLKALGQAARKEMQTLAKLLEERLAPFKMDRVSNWANQAQICRPHFWCYYRAPEDSLDDVAMAIRLYGQPEKWGISVEVSFVERKKSDTTLAKQHKVLDLPITFPLYYLAQEDGKMVSVIVWKGLKRIVRCSKKQSKLVVFERSWLNMMSL